ncbi:hypothetical protein PLEOSDRAFT_1100115 [Pleurotus ostreatus PC15]|uniref:Uncharacterized protein n=1 Tax=Pleurotus ostreatus (strain PC15) TaxID=1137138 RepID=A0A067PE84_PLEO1|nr:hypothetical protein PLEOSDRAFT_1100115 [Pleurotus ostreatus PC15]
MFRAALLFEIRTRPPTAVHSALYGPAARIHPTPWEYCQLSNAKELHSSAVLSDPDRVDATALATAEVTAIKIAGLTPVAGMSIPNNEQASMQGVLDSIAELNATINNMNAPMANMNARMTNMDAWMISMDATLADIKGLCAKNQAVSLQVPGRGQAKYPHIKTVADLVQIPTVTLDHYLDAYGVERPGDETLRRWALGRCIGIHEDVLVTKLKVT